MGQSVVQVLKQAVGLAPGVAQPPCPVSASALHKELRAIARAMRRRPSCCRRCCGRCRLVWLPSRIGHQGWSAICGTPHRRLPRSGPRQSLGTIPAAHLGAFLGFDHGPSWAARCHRAATWVKARRGGCTGGSGRCTGLDGAPWAPWSSRMDSRGSHPPWLATKSRPIGILNFCRGCAGSSRGRFHLQGRTA